MIDNEQTLFRKGLVNPIEKRANKYAEGLLMPSELLIDEVNKIKEKLFPNTNNNIGIPNIYKIVKKISEIFKVSKPAVIIRLYAIGKIKERAKKKLFDYHHR